MEDEDFVADSDEDEQEMLEALAMAEERLARQRLEAGNHQQEESQVEPKDQNMEQSTAILVTPEQSQAVREHDTAQVEVAEDREPDGELEVDEEQGLEGEEKTDKEQDDEEETEGVLEVGTLVEVESRTWPGINKQGGAGRITRVHREKSKDGEAEDIFYDVRYVVVGGFERHIEREYVHSSDFVNRHSSRVPIDREYYHDDYINKPHERKQREAKKKREQMMAHPEQAKSKVPQHTGRKRKRPQRSTRAERVPDKLDEDLLSSDDEMEGKREVLRIGEDMFVLTERNGNSREASSRPPNDREISVRKISSPVVEQPTVSTVKQRRRHRILDSSDEESSDGDEAGDKRNRNPDQPDHLKRTNAQSNEFLAAGGSEQGNRENSVDQHRRRQRKKRKTNRLRFVGGYEHNAEDADGRFIQPEGNPDDLPEDVARETGIRLASTRHGLMKQLQEVFAQQQENIANFHEEQKMVDQKMEDLSGMPMSDLQDLYRKVFDLDKVFLTKTLVNAGEDVMDSISKKLDRHGKPPDGFEQLDTKIGEWKDELKDCSRWVHAVKEAVGDAFARRNAQIPVVQVAQAEYSSDSSYSADDFDAGDIEIETAAVASASDNIDFSFDYEVESASNSRNQNRQLDYVSIARERRPNVSKAGKPNNRKKTIRSTTMEDYFSQRGPSNRFRSNFRLTGRQKKILPSDPRFDWVRIARKKQQRVGSAIRDRSTGPSSLDFSNRHGSVHAVHEVRSANVSSREDRNSVQAQRMHLRNERFRGPPKKQRPRGSLLAQSAPQTVRSSSQPVYPAGISFDDVTPERRQRPVEVVNTTIRPSNSNQHAVNWEAIFEVVVDGPSTTSDEDAITAISRQEKEGLLAFGHPICGPLTPPYLFSDEEYEFEDPDRFRDIVTRQTLRLRQLVNNLRLQESTFVDSLSRGGLGAVDEEGYASTPEWIVLVSLEEAYHRAIASFAAQLLQALEGVSPSALSSCLEIVLVEVAALIRQLPDCDSLFNGCKAYFFFFEVASRDATTTPFLTAVSRTYWYCLDLLVALRPMADLLVGSHGTTKQKVEDVFRRALPVNRFILAVVLYLFDLYIYLPSSHRAEDQVVNGSPGGASPALSLWMLVRSCCSSSAGVDQTDHASLSAKEKHFWALLQAVYRQRYFDELARCFVRTESCGGYLRDFEPNATDSSKTEDCDEIFESQLLALEATWGLLAVLTRIYADPDDDKHEEAVCDAKWAVVKDLLQPDKPNFLPFNSFPHQPTNLQSDYRQCANFYKQHVLKRVTAFSKQWYPSKEVVELILRQLWGNDVPRHPDDIAELPQLLKQFATRCKDLGNSRLRLAAFAEEHNGDGDTTTALCKIIWVQLLKLEKRVHRSRFRRVVLNAIPDTPDSQQVIGNVPSTAAAALKTSGTNWNWGPKQHNPANVQPAQRPEALQQRSSTSSGVGKERMSTAVLLVFAIVGVCMECGDDQHFPVERSDKDVRYMEREVDFYCKEILRWTSGKPACEVLAAQSLFTLGALLLEKNSTEFPTVFRGLNERLESSVKHLQANPLVSPTAKQSAGPQARPTKTSNVDDRRQRLQNAAMSPLYQMRDLTRKMLETPSSDLIIGPAFGSAVEKSLEHIFGAGMEACLITATQKIITVHDLKVAMNIFQLVLPRTPDEPKQSFASTLSVFDNGLDNLLAEADWESLLSGRDPRPAPAWTVKECRPKAVQLITSNLKGAIQQLVLNYPSTDVPTFAEIYAIDLLGMMISTCTVQFFWSYVTSLTVKHRNLAPRLLGAALKYNPEKEWLRNVFLRESGSDQELSTAWLLGTLDVAALNSTPIVFKLEDVPFGVITQERTSHQSRVRDSDYWVMLTDGIIYHLLRNDSVGFGAMDPLVLQLLREVASTCKFHSSVRANEAAFHDADTLYDLHLDVFQSFCKSAGNSWNLYSDPQSSNRHEMNQFHSKMVKSPSAIFVSFLEAYKINFRRACSEIDHWNHSWHRYGELFLRQAGVNAAGGRSYHEVDDTIKSFDERLTGLTTMFRFMYQCMDALLFYCGEMAIGEKNLFFDAMELLFRQVNSAEYPLAIKRLEDQRRLVQRDGVRSVNDELRKGFCSASMRFVDSVQLFFARQKYPSLLHWFAQTCEIYQTFKTGWDRSHLRTLLVNILDPDGPLGIHSYYPDVETSKDPTLDIDVKAVRREAFYLSCGFFNCRCTRSFEHSRANPTPTSCKRLQKLRKFVLDDFMRKTFSFVLKEDITSLLETMVPVCQFMRAVLNHANLNMSRPRATEFSAKDGLDSLAHFDFQLNELHSCLEWIVECLIKLVPGEEVVNSTICCVLLTELCGVMCEAITFNDNRPMLELIDLIELVLSYLQTVYVALSKRTTAKIGTLFATSVEVPVSAKLRAYRFSPSAFRDIVVDKRFTPISGQQMDSYGIPLARAATDLLTAIGRVAQHCKTSNDERLRGFTTISP
ncbi:hypothetical protein L916_11546 [Phytophthora nicotianae]|uniref:Uncharacterized protein n=1 Tax=Phytophthora nicotianae TaxID=4792 RepID=W2IQT7_PHYNI|nr:hypothetical protein L916_11546 [Phytophthora nicotianae]